MRRLWRWLKGEPSEGEIKALAFAMFLMEHPEIGMEDALRIIRAKGARR